MGKFYFRSGSKGKSELKICGTAVFTDKKGEQEERNVALYIDICYTY